MFEYLDRVAEGEDPRLVISDMILDIQPPGNKSPAKKKTKASNADSNKHGEKPGEPGSGPTSQTSR